jgi:hypothetical protein
VTASHPLDMPAEKLKAIQEVGSWTMPPVEGTPVPWVGSSRGLKLRAP